MEYKEEMLLESSSGFCMPFLLGDGEELESSLGYGEQVHPSTGEKFHHRGIDYLCRHKPLFALATGTVIGLGTDAVHGNYLIIRYGKYEVKYGHLSEAFVGYGDKVYATQKVATSGDFLHIGVTFNGEELDPADFLSMVYGNYRTLAAMGIHGTPEMLSFDMPVDNGYDADQDSILEMMARWLPAYYSDLIAGSYRPSERVERGLRNVFAQSADKRYLFEQMPSMVNPLGLTERSAPLAGKVQNLLISDFLAYMASRHGMYVPSWTDQQKKNLTNRFVMTALP